MKSLLRRKLGVFCSLAALAGVAPAIAQSTPTPQTRPASPDRPAQLLNPVQVIGQVSDIVLALNLSDYQKAQAQELLDKASQQAKDLQANQDLSAREKVQQISAVVKHLRQQLGDILNVDQVRELQTKLSELRPEGPGGQSSILNLRDAIAKLDLSTDQRQQIGAVLLDLAPDIGAVREKAQNGEDVRDDVQKIRDQIKEKLGKILTADQQQQLRDLMEPGSPGNQEGKSSGQPGDTMMSAAGEKAPPSPANSKVDSKIKELLDAAGPGVGAAAPDVKIQESEGHEVSLSSLKGHVVVIEFGSLSCPSFRDRAAEMEKLKNEVGSGAIFMLVYTREVYPAGEDQVERNRVAKIDISQPGTLEARKELASRARSMLHISFPITVDDMDDHLAAALGGFPNGCLIIGKGGEISARQHWTDPSDLRRLIDEANEPKK